MPGKEEVTEWEVGGLEGWGGGLAGGGGGPHGGVDVESEQPRL